MKPAWFRPWGPTYRPTSWQGVALTLVAVALSATAFILVDRHSHSASDTLYGVAPYWLAALVSLHGAAIATAGGGANRTPQRP